jgi:predicted unusual protein kinase regulating ubiquinone biosynthesis (AarF/ABC1/UbiB family)
MEKEDQALSAFLERLRATVDRPVPTGGFSRMARTARSALGTAANVLLSRRGGEGGGLGDVDLRSMEKLVASLGELKGVPMKAGQILSYVDVSLPPETRGLLALLQTQSQPTPWLKVQQVVREDLGPRAEELLAHMDPCPASVASIGQVHRATLPDGTPVAVKVRHPGIQEAITADFQLAGAGTAFARLAVPGAGATAQDFMREARERMLEECDYRLEARRQEAFGELFKGDPEIVVPALHDRWCGPRVLVTTWEEGQAWEEFLASAPPASLRDRVGAALFRFYVGTLYRHGIFHADPHPGNYRLRGDGTLVVFDYGCVRAFDRPSVAALVRLAEAVRVDDVPAIREALCGLGALPPDHPAAMAHVRGLLRGFFGPMLVPGPHTVDARVTVDMRQVAKDKLALGRLRLPGKLLFLFRIRFGLYAVLDRLGAVQDWAALERDAAREA